MSLEIELLEQLLDDDLTVQRIVTLFEDWRHCRQAVKGLLVEGDIELLDVSGNSVPPWRWRELLRDNEPGNVVSDEYRLRITKWGANKV